MSIRDLRTVEKIQGKSEKSLSSICKHFEKKIIVEYSGKLRGNFENLWENF